MLKKEFREAYLIFENNPSQENQTTLSVPRERIEKLYEEKVEGIIVRSRARWHEHGEKNSKYFFNLEKRNHIKKHIRKLRMSGVITTDPFEILDAGKTFYENLYKSKRNSRQQNKQYFKFWKLAGHPHPTPQPGPNNMGPREVKAAEALAAAALRCHKNKNETDFLPLR